MTIEIVMIGLYLIGIFTALVVAHELGHMWVAKWYRMWVQEFAIGMGPLLLRLGKDRSGTLYTVRAYRWYDARRGVGRGRFPI